MDWKRRSLPLLLLTGRPFAAQDFPQFPGDDTTPDHPRQDTDKLPDGKSRNNAIAADEHKKALEEADRLIKLAESLKKEISDAGKYVVPVAAIRHTEDIEKLARKIRGRLDY